MFRGRRDDMIALLGIHLGHAFERQVVRLGGAAGEYDLFRGCADEVRDLFTGLLDRLFRLPPEAVVAAGSIPEHVGEVGRHRGEDAWIDRRRRVIVHVDRQFHSKFLQPLLRRLLLIFWAACSRTVHTAVAEPSPSPVPEIRPATYLKW